MSDYRNNRNENDINNRDDSDLQPWRKFLYYLGQVLTIVGFILFISTFFRVFGVFLNPDNFESIFGGFRISFVGFFMILIGQVLKNIGKGGLAGSGVILDPKKERDDMEPFSRSKGGMAADFYDEFKKDSGFNGAQRIMVRCLNCKTLNDEDAKFCDNCGKEL